MLVATRCPSCGSSSGWGHVGSGSPGHRSSCAPRSAASGQTSSPASVVLEEHTLGRWTARSARADEVGEIVTEVLGMGLAQFSKVVLLPQGEFAAFLRATADERRTLLEKLFDISTYTGVETWLVDRRRQLGAELAEARTALGADLARLETVLAQVSGDVLQDGATGAGRRLGRPPRRFPARAPGRGRRSARRARGGVPGRRQRRGGSGRGRPGGGDRSGRVGRTPPARRSGSA